MQKVLSKKLLLWCSLFTLVLLVVTPVSLLGQMGSALDYNTGMVSTLTAQIPMGIYLFKGGMGDLVTVHVASTDGLLNPLVTVVGPSQQTVATNDDDNFMPSSRDAFVSVFLPESGVYSILVTSSDGTMGEYLLRLNGRPALTQATVLQFNMPVDVEIPPHPQPQYFIFAADPNCPTTLTITDLDSGLPLTFPFTAIVRDQDGTRIALLQGGRALEDSVTVMPGSGVYEVEVASADVYASGRVRLEVGCIDSVPVCRAPGAGRLLPLPPPRTRIPPPTPPGPNRQVTPVPRVTPNSGQPYCGDGIVQPEILEQCEPPGTASCDVKCGKIGASQPGCGDGVVQADRGEQCDPPNGGTCDNQCQNIVTQQQPICGDGIVQASNGEQCEPPGTSSCDVKCQAIQQPQPICGDGVVQPANGEQCEPPGTASCDVKCQPIQPQPYCGDGIVQGSEQCDPPDGSSCDNQCQKMSTAQPYCGDGIVQADRGEQCDPPNGITCTDATYKGGACLIIPG